MSRRPARRGPGHLPDNPYCGVVSQFSAAAIAGKPLLVHGDGGQTRDFTYLDDAVDGGGSSTSSRVGRCSTGSPVSLRTAALP